MGVKDVLREVKELSLETHTSGRPVLANLSNPSSPDEGLASHPEAARAEALSLSSPQKDVAEGVSNLSLNPAETRSQENVSPFEEPQDYLSDNPDDEFHVQEATEKEVGGTICSC